ncbi:MAG: carbon storage regulator [Polyangiaceae bacterium]
MLVVARRKGQRIIVGGDIEIFVNEISRGTVKLGIRAPARCTIMRGEAFDAVERANREACASSVEDALLATAKK